MPCQNTDNYNWLIRIQSNGYYKPPADTLLKLSNSCFQFLKNSNNFILIILWLLEIVKNIANLIYKNSMKITHFNNSFILVNEGDESIICDPWVGKANNGGWQSFPEFSMGALSAKLISAEWVYISHLHSDHFNPITIKLLRLRDKKFIIKKYKNNTLKNRLLKIGITKIYELNPFEVYKFGSFELSTEIFQ